MILLRNTIFLPKKIKQANPNARFFKVMFGGEFVAHSQTLRIPIIKSFVKQESVEEKLLKELDFEKVARFRCNQNNVTKALDSITFSSDIKTQYLLSTGKEEEKYFHVLLEDYIYQINPKELDISFQLVKPVELFKNDLIFTQNNQSKITKILNFSQIERKWKHFKSSTLPNIDFFKQLKQQSEKAAYDFIKTGNLEFTNESNFKETLYKNLFHHILLKANVGDDLQDYHFTQNSQIFPNQEITIKVTKTKVSENENTIVFRLVGELDRKKLSDIKLKEQYDEIYRPLLKYAYTEYDYVYRITYTLDAKTGLLIDGKVSISEKVKNNFESITQFDLKQVEL